jgi:hypothetical protein
LEVEVEVKVEVKVEVEVEVEVKVEVKVEVETVGDSPPCDSPTRSLGGGGEVEGGVCWR